MNNERKELFALLDEVSFFLFNFNIALS